MKVPLPNNKYIRKIEVNTNHLEIDFAKRKKVALLFISLNDSYWPYLKQVMEDCKINFLPQHKVDYFVWSDMPEKDSPEYTNLKNTGWWTKEQLKATVDSLRADTNVQVMPTEAIEWPAPTLMRYHLFLQKEEELKGYDYVFYLDADMRVVDKISDEILSEGLLAAEHPMYSLRKEYIPPYEPNPESTAYIPRPGKVVDENGKKRFRPFYYAGGFQGGKSKDFIKAMKVMRDKIDTDFNKNYVAIWNDESHWNRYLFEYKGPLVVLPPSYVYPDSLIKEYYEPIWGRSYEPKIITLTKPFTLSKEGGAHLNEFMGNKAQERFSCPTCKDVLEYAGHKITKVVQCPGSGKAHQLEMVKV